MNGPGSAEMAHGDIVLDEDLSALVDGELPAAHEAELRERARLDAVLSARLAAFERVNEALAALPAVAPSSSLREALRTRIERERSPAASHRRRAAWIGAGLAAAASVAVYLVVAGSGSAPELGDVPEPVAAADAFEQATDEELGIALDYETLAGLDGLEELDVIEQLDLLERMAALAEDERG